MKITYDTEEAVKKEAAALRKEEEKLSRLQADFEQAEDRLSALQEKARETADLVPLAGATKEEAEDLATRSSAVEKTLRALRKDLEGQRAARDKASAQLEKARGIAVLQQRREAERVSADLTQRYHRAISEAVRLGLEIEELRKDLLLRGITGIRPWPVPLAALLPTSMQKDHGKVLHSVVQPYKALLERELGIDTSDLYDGSEITQFDAMAERLQHEAALRQKRAAA